MFYVTGGRTVAKDVHIRGVQRQGWSECSKIARALHIAFFSVPRIGNNDSLRTVFKEFNMLRQCNEQDHTNEVSCKSDISNA